MNKEIIKKIARPIQKFLGIEDILNKQKLLIREIHELRRVTSQLEFTPMHTDGMREPARYQNAKKLVSLLSPMDIAGAKYRRLGQHYDGGYVMLDDFSARKIDAAYSFGIGGDVSWDEAIANMGIHVYMYDHTIDKLPKTNPRFHFIKEGVTCDTKQKGLDTLSNFISRNGHQSSQNLLLKMDVEGHEWSALDHTPRRVISQFSQIVLELHGMNQRISNRDISQMLRVLEKLNETHQSIHVHANGQNPIDWLGELTLPNDLEVTYIRRSDYIDQFIPNSRVFPTPIDQPTSRYLPDIPLGTFSLSEKES